MYDWHRVGLGRYDGVCRGQPRAHDDHGVRVLGQVSGLDQVGQLGQFVKYEGKVFSRHVEVVWRVRLTRGEDHVLGQVFEGGYFLGGWQLLVSRDLEQRVVVVLALAPDRVALDDVMGYGH